MNIRNIATIVVITLILSSSGVWGARLIKSQSQTDEQNAQKSAGSTAGKTTQTQSKNAQSTAPNQGRSVANPPTPTSPYNPVTPHRQSQTARSGREDIAPPPSSPESRMEKGSAAKDETQKDGKQYVTMDFDGVDIRVFVKFVADITGKNFILDDKVAGKITVISPRKMTLDEAYQVFLSVLDVNGFGTVNMGGVIKIVQAADAVTRSIGTSMETPKRREDVLITQIIPLKHVESNDMKTLFTPLLTRGSSQLLAYPQSNILIITDTKSNIKKMMEILKFIDVSGFSEDFRIFPLTHASAADLGTKLQDILSEDGAAGTQRMRTPGQRGNLSDRGKAKIIPYERTNSLIVLASSTDMARVESLIGKLDIPTPTGKEDVHVYYLQYANAESLAKVLTDMPTPAKAENPPASQGATPNAGPSGMRSVANNEKVKISSDKETNSLVIYADPDAYQSLVDTIKYLDIPRKQVYVKAMIMEVNQDKDFKIGVEWSFFEDFSYDSRTGADGTRERRTGAVFGRSGETFIAGPSNLPAGALMGIVGEAITVGSGDTKITFPNMTSFISAMQHDADVNIIATPQIITMDNKEAEIRVGANVPYLTREDTDSTNIDRTVRTYDYRDVGVTLRMTPQINQQGNIRLELFQENTSLVPGTGQDYAPTTLKRSAKTTVTVKDGSTMVIGGLIGHTLTERENGVPYLSKIPVLGYLFKTMLNRNEKTNLYIFLNPRIIDTEEKVTGLYKEKYGDILSRGVKLDERGNIQKEEAKKAEGKKEDGKANENPKP